MNAREIREQLGLTVKRYDEIMARAYGHVLEQLEAGPDQETTWTRKQRSLLLSESPSVRSSRPNLLPRARRALATAIPFGMVATVMRRAGSSRGCTPLCR